STSTGTGKQDWTAGVVGNAAPDHPTGPDPGGLGAGAEHRRARTALANAGGSLCADGPHPLPPRWLWQNPAHVVGRTALLVSRPHEPAGEGPSGQCLQLSASAVAAQGAAMALSHGVPAARHPTDAGSLRLWAAPHGPGQLAQKRG